MNDDRCYRSMLGQCDSRIRSDPGSLCSAVHHEHSGLIRSFGKLDGAADSPKIVRAGLGRDYYKV